MGEAVEFFNVPINGFSKNHYDSDSTIFGSINNDNNNNNHANSWFEEVIDVDLKWSFAINRFVKFNFNSQLYPIIVIIGMNVHCLYVSSDLFISLSSLIMGKLCFYLILIKTFFLIVSIFHLHIMSKDSLVYFFVLQLICVI